MGSFSYWRKYVHDVLINRLGGLSLPRKSVFRLTDRPDMTLDAYRGRKTTIQQQQSYEPYIVFRSMQHNTVDTTFHVVRRLGNAERDFKLS